MRSPRISRTDRAQSAVVGVILLTAVIVILMGVFGVFFLGSVNDRANGSGPLVDAEVNATDERVSVTHGGGDSVDADGLAITLRLEGESERYGFDDGIVTRSATDDDPERFEPTERVE